jgi:tetratricopeptide (TPR) repeat protein
MGSGAKLDGTGGAGESNYAGARACGIILFALFLLPLNSGAERRPLRKAAATTALGTTQETDNKVGLGAALDLSSDPGRLIAAQAAFDAGRYDNAARLARGPDNQSADLDFLAGLSLAKLQRWNDARSALSAGHRKAPEDARFLVEVAGVDYKLKNARAAKRELREALKLDPHDAYTLEFLGTLYFLDGNLEAALNYWNAIDKPRLRNVSVQPTPKVDEALLQPAIGFNAPQVLTGDVLLGAEARLDNLGLFPHRRVELSPATGGNYDATLNLPERNLWGDTWWEGALSWFSGLPYATVYPEIYNLDRRAVNVTSLLRWDSEKRRAFAEISAPVMRDPKLRLRFYFDGRNENWNLSNTFFGPGAALSDLNVRRVAGGAELRSVVNGRWNWSAGVEIANRSFRNLTPQAGAAGKSFFSDGNSLAYWVRADRSLLRVPERRFTIDGSAEARVGREFANNLGSYGVARGSLSGRWLPQAKGDDYEMQIRLRAGEAFGDVPFDELFQLGIERDNDLWLRGHAGTHDGRKGAAPLGRRYFLANWEVDKNIYSNGFFTVKLGPFVDNGAIADSSGLFGSQRWLWDAGAQCKIRVLGSMTVVLSYGRDLRGGRNVYYGTVVH